MPEKIILIGGGSHANSCIDVINYNNDFEIEFIIDNNNKNFFYTVLKEEKFDNDKLKNSNAIIAIGQLKDGGYREKIFKKYINYGCKFPKIVSKKSYLSFSSSVSEGTIVMHNVTINSNVKIGKNCIINTGSIIEHDVIIEDNVHVAPGAIILGGCTIKKNCFIGSNSTIKQERMILENSVIKANQYYNK